MNQLSHKVDVLFEQMFLKHPELIQEVRKRQFTVADTELSSRRINTLDADKLIPDNREDAKQWRKFNLNDLLFLHIVEHCRQFNMDNSRLKGLRELFYEQKVNYVKIGEVTATEEALITMFTGVVPIAIQIFSNGDVNLSDDPNLFIKNATKGIPAITLLLHETFKEQIVHFIERNKLDQKFGLDNFSHDYDAVTPNRSSNFINWLSRRNNYEKIVIIKKPDGKIIVEGYISIDATKFNDADVKKIEESFEFGRVEKSFRNGKVSSLKTIDTYVI